MDDAHSAAPRNGVLQLAGYGIRVSVERGHLRVEDGVGRSRRVGRFYRADRSLRRLIVLGHSGEITLDALRWLHDVGASFAQIDTDGRVIAAAGPVKLQDARLRRAQARAVERDRGPEIAKVLVREKLVGQLRVLDRIRAVVPMSNVSLAASVIERAIDRLAAQGSFDQIRWVEGEAASAYWRAWSAVPVRFERADVEKVPFHWTSFGRRASLLTGNPRRASNPANAVLNYLYAIAEAEARIAALGVGCDPGIGILHADQKMRDSLACDLMEPVRPVVDAWALDLFEARTFRKADFFETREGGCRILPSLSRILARTGPQWAEAVAPVAERLVEQLLTASNATPRGAGPAPTPLTQENRSDGRPGPRVRRRERKIPVDSEDRERFRTEILPALRHLTLKAIMRAIPVSKGYCSLIRSGKRVPHPKHWGALRDLVG